MSSYCETLTTLIMRIFHFGYLIQSQYYLSCDVTWESGWDGNMNGEKKDGDMEVDNR